MSWIEPAARWYGLLLLATLCWAPWVRLLAGRLPDRGATIGRPLALLAMVYPAWLIASTGWVPYSTGLLWATLAVASIAGWSLLIWRRQVDRTWLLALIAAEALSLVGFVGYLWLRGFTPQILHTEKPMDTAFLMSSSITTTMPPPDPWFAGLPINYYYLGYLLQGTLSRLSDIPGTTGFNLALATVFSMALTAAAGAGWNIVRGWYSTRSALIAAVVTATMLMLAGNLYAALQLARTPAETLAAGWWDKEFGVGWRASRIVCDTVRVANDCEGRFETINEFPAFSFILGDLHPHVLALPFTIAALILTLNLVLRFQDNQKLSHGDWLRLGFTGAVIGSLYAMNSWDFPTYLAIAAVAVWWSCHRAWRPVALLAATSVVAWLPFFATFVAPTGVAAAYLPEPLRSLPMLPRLVGIISVHTGERTSVGEFLTIFGVPYLLGVWLVAGWWLQARDSLSPGATRGAAIALAILAFAAILSAAPLLVVCGAPLMLALVLLPQRPELNPRLIGAALFAAGLLLVIGTEFIYIQDVFQNRMNTLFKFYYQVWVLFAVAGGAAVVVIWRQLLPRPALRSVLAVVTAAGLVAGLVYPVLSARQWTSEFAAWAGLDGIEYVGEHSADELAAIRWLQAHARPDDVLLEAAGCSYQVNGAIPFSRASAFSGVPTVIGWRGHEEQWRHGSPELLTEIRQRGADVAAMFADPSSDLVDAYGVTLLYVGRYEHGDWRHICDLAGLYPGLDQPGYPGPDWEPVFNQGEVTIYRRAEPTPGA